MRATAFFAVAGCLLLLPCLARAQAPAAEGLFEQGRAALAAGDLETACARFKASDAIDPGPGVKAYLAACLEKEGKLASAWESFRRALQTLPQGDERRAKIEDRIRGLEPRLSRLELVLAPGAPKETVVRENGAPLGLDGTWGVPLPLDPGTHRLEVLVPGEAARRLDVVLVEGKLVQVAVGSDASSGRSSSGPGPFIVGGIGLAGLAVGFSTLAVVVGQHNAFNADCNTQTQTCTPAGRSAASLGRTLGPVSTASLAIGGVGVLAGGIWLGVGSSTKPHARVGIGPVPGGGGLRASGSW